MPTKLDPHSVGMSAGRWSISCHPPRIADAQPAVAENKLLGVSNPAREAALWANDEEALKHVLEIGEQQLEQPDIEVLPTPSMNQILPFTAPMITGALFDKHLGL